MAADDAANTFVSFASGDVLEEDDERNRKQAKRNRNIRGLLERRKAALPAEVKPTAFGEVETITSAASSPPNSANAVAEENPPPWLSLRDEASVNLRLHEELLDFANFMRPSPPEVAAREAWCRCIEKAAKATLGDSCEVHLFGSSSTGLNLPSADIDVAVAGVEGVRATTAMKRIANWLLEKGEVSKIEIVQSARVPVAKLQQRSTGLWADVIINRLDGIETSKFIRDHMEVFPALAPLVLFLKLFLLQRGLHETFGGGLGSYLLVCLVLSFLQRHPSARKHDVHAKTTLGNLLFDLFRHYGQEFRYGQVGISLLNGGCLFDRVARGFTATTRTGQATLCLESPTEAGRDIGVGCHRIGVVRAAFNHAYHSLGKIFLSKVVPGPSLLCPMLVSQTHKVVADRYSWFKEQKSPILELAAIPDSDEEDEDSNAKRRKLNEAANANQTGAAVVDEAELARRNFEMMLQPVDGLAPGSTKLLAGSGVEEAELQMLEELDTEDLGAINAPPQQNALPRQPVFAEGPAAPVPVWSSPEVVPLVCPCGEMFLPGAKFCSECGVKRSALEALQAPPAAVPPVTAVLATASPPIEPAPLHFGAAVDEVDAEELELEPDNEASEPLESAPAPDVFAIVAEDQHDLDEAGIFLEAMAEVEAAARSPGGGSPPVSPAAYGGSSYGDDNMALFLEQPGEPGIAYTEEPIFAAEVSAGSDAVLENAEALMAGLEAEAVSDPFTEDFVAC